MLMGVKKYLRLFLMYMKVNISSAMEYRLSFFALAFGMVFNNLCFIAFWAVIFGKFKNIAGYSMNDMLLLWAFTTSAFGFSFIVFGNSWNLSKVIYDGGLDSYLLQPKDVLLSVLLSRSIMGSWGDLAFGYAIILLLYGFAVTKLFLFTLFCIIGAVFIVSSITIIHTFTFYLGNVNSLGSMAVDILGTLGTYPENIYNKWVRWIVYTILPAGFVAFVPLKLLKGFNFANMLELIVIGAGYSLFAYGFFRVGLRKYESGNLITTKL